jgi:hypothetical protein
VQLHILRIGSARGTRRAAIDTCRHDRVPDMTVRRLVTSDDPRPTRIIRNRWRGRFPRTMNNSTHSISSSVHNDLSNRATIAVGLHSAPCFRTQSRKRSQVQSLQRSGRLGQFQRRWRGEGTTGHEIDVMQRPTQRAVRRSLRATDADHVSDLLIAAIATVGKISGW